MSQQNDMLMKWKVDKMAKYVVFKLIQFKVNENWWKSNLMNDQIEKIASWGNAKLTKWLGIKISTSIIKSNLKSELPLKTIL